MERTGLGLRGTAVFLPCALFNINTLNLGGLHITGEPLRNIPFDTTTNHMRNSKHPIGIECLVFVAPLVSKEEPRDISHDEEWSELEMSLFLLVDVITWKHGRSSAHYARCAVAPRSL